MKPTPKADLCIKIIKEISYIVYSIGRFNNGKYTNEYINLFKQQDKLELLLATERERLSNIKKSVSQLDFLCNYRLLPFMSIKHLGSSSFMGKNDDIKDSTKSFLIEKEVVKADEFEDFWYIVTNYDEVTTDDLKAEFWEISESIEAFNNSYKIMKSKYKDVFSNIPDSTYYEYFKLIEAVNIKSYINYVVDYKIATKDEIEHLIFRICNVVEFLNMKVNSIVSLYKSFISDDNSPDVSTPQLPKELDTPEAKEIFTQAVEVGLMEVQGNCYKWHKSKVLLAYMLNKIYTDVFPATELDKLFGVSGLKQAVYSLPNNKKPPKGYEEIDRLFEEA